MASYNKFSAFVNNLCDAALNLATTGDTLKVMLTNTAPVATNSLYGDISANELASGAGYTTGGTATTITASSQSSGTYKLVCAHVVFTATGSMGPFRYVVLYDTTTAVVSKPLIAWWDYGSSIT